MTAVDVHIAISVKYAKLMTMLCVKVDFSLFRCSIYYQSWCCAAIYYCW